MDTKFLIGKFVGELQTSQIFITRECLTFGTRAAVDSVLWNMVSRGLIIRLANGVFVRNDIGMKMPSLAEIIKAKARAHVRRAISHGADLALRFKLAPKPRRRVKNQKDKSTRDKGAVVACCAVIGDTTRFNTIYGRVEFRRTPARKFCLGEGKSSQVLAAWWASSCETKLERMINDHLSRLGKIEKKRFKEVGAWAPAWISDLLLDDPPRFSTQAPKTIHPRWSVELSGDPDFDPRVNESAANYRVDFVA